MNAKEIRDTAKRVLDYALKNSTIDANRTDFKCKKEQILTDLSITEELLKNAIVYLQGSEMLYIAQIIRGGELQIMGIGFKAINWLADFQ